MKIASALAALGLLASQPAEAQVSSAAWCRNHPERVGACRIIRGRLMAYNGTPTFRVWVVGTNRIVAPIGRDAVDVEAGAMFPSNIRTALGAHPFERQVFADFEICPVERQRPGWMQHVCIVRATRLRVVRLEV